MATIRAYTTIEQSRKLAEILPHESADGGLYRTNNPLAANNKYWLYTKYTEKAALPAWSLAALLGVLPKRIEFEGVAYELSIYLNGLYYWNINNGNLLLEVKGKDNLVDACVDMIEKLHELNLL